MVTDFVVCLKEDGNDLFRAGHYSAAVERYEEAIKHLNSGGTTDDVKVILYSNIAQCNIKLRRWGEAVVAATAAIEINPFSEKALYRRAVAQEQLGHTKESLDDSIILVRRGHKEAVAVVERLQTKLAADRSRHLEETLPETILATVVAATEKLECQKLLHPPYLSVEDTNQVVQGIDTLRSWVVGYNRKQTIVKCGTIPKLVAFLKVRTSHEPSSPSPAVDSSSSPADVPIEVPMAGVGHSTGSSDQHQQKSSTSIVDEAPTNSTPAAIEDANIGRIRPLVANHEILRIHLAIWRILAALISDVDFTDEDVKHQRQCQMLEKPVEVDPLVAKAREIFITQFSFEELFELYKAYVRAGLGALDDLTETVQKDNLQKSDAAIRSRCAVLISETLRCTGTLDGGACLEILALGVGCIECRAVVRAALQSLGGLADGRRRYGSKVKALKKNQALMKALENVLQLLSSEDEKIKEDAEFALASVFALLADKDRAPEDEICVQELAYLLLGPYFVQGREPTDSLTGLRGLLLLWMADRDTVKIILSTNDYISVLVNLTCNRDPACPTLQRIAAEVLMHAMEFGELRIEAFNVGVVPSLAVLCQCQLRHEKDTDLRIKVVATLARLCMHSEEVREDVFEEFDFFRVASDSLRQFRLLRPDFSNSNSHSIVEFKQRLRNFLELLFFLTLHGAFKSKLLHLLECELNGPDVDSTLASTFSDIGESLVVTKDGLGGYYFSNVFCNLLRSREDKETRRRRKNQSGPQLDDEQMDALQEFFEKLPEHSLPAQNGKFDRGSTEVVSALAEVLMRCKIVRQLSQLCQLKNSTLNELSAASEAIGLFAKEQKNRGIVVQQGAVPALLTSAKALQGGGVTYEQDLSRCRQSLAHVCISINPNFLTYREVLDIVPHLLSLLGDSYELYQYEACLALTNITSASEDARNRVFHGHGWRGLLDVATGENDMCRAAGLEGLCNMAMCELVQDRFAEGFQTVDLQLLLAFLGEKQNPRAQAAAAGCLAILTSDMRIALRVCTVSNVGNIARTILDESDMREKPDILLRVATIASNIASAVKIDQPMLVKEPKTKDEEPMLISVTEEMKSVKKNICEALREVDRSYYSADVLKLIESLDLDSN